VGNGGRGKRHRNGRPRTVQNPEERECSYFQQRSRRGVEAYRTWLSESVEEYMEEGQSSRAGGVLELLDVTVVIEGSTGTEQVGNRPAEYQQHLRLAERLLKCYLPSTGTFDVQTRNGIQMDIRRTYMSSLECGTVRREPTGQGWHQVSDAGLALSLDATLSLPEYQDTGEARVHRVLLVDVDVFPTTHSRGAANQDFIFHAPLMDVQGEWLASTWNSYSAFGPENPFRIRTFLAVIVHAGLAAAGGLSACENTPCMMNTTDGTEDIQEVTLLLCPGCMRKLALIGALPDAPKALQAIQTVYQEAGGTALFPTELQTLTRWLSTPPRNQPSPP